jgi:hypothetical protein
MKRWLKRLAKGVLVVLGLLALVLFIGRASVQRTGERKLADLTARLDATEPGWRIDEIEARRLAASPPADQNSAAIVRRTQDRFPVEWENLNQSGGWPPEYLSNAHPDFIPFVWMLLFRDATTSARDEAREALLRPDVLARPGGRYAITIADNPLDTVLPHVQKSRLVFGFLNYDARLAALEGNPDRGIRAARAGLVASRSIGDEPIWISQLVRMAGDRVASQSAFQVLAWSEPKAGLAELQTEFRAEADFPWIEVCLRGERATLDKLFENIQTGKLSSQNLSEFGVPSGLSGPILSYYRGFVPEDRAASLRIMTEYVEASRLPYPEQMEAFARITLPPRPPDDVRYILSNLFLPSFAKIAQAGIRTRSELLAASVAIACERFRQANGRWPKTLDEIPKEILPEIPTDPSNGQPMGYRVLPDGVAVFCVQDNDANTVRHRRETRDPLAALGRGWKLWNPDLRGKPTPATPPPEDPVDQPGATKTP